MDDNDSTLIILLKKNIEQSLEKKYGTNHEWFMSFLKEYQNGENHDVYDRVLMRTVDYGTTYMKDSPILSFALQFLFEGLDDDCMQQSKVFDNLWFTITNDGLQSITQFSDYITKSVMNEQLKSQSALFLALKEYYREKVCATLKDCNISDKRNLHNLVLDDVVNNGWLSDVNSIKDEVTPKSYNILLEKLHSYHQKKEHEHKLKQKQPPKQEKKTEKSESSSSDESEEEEDSFKPRAGFTAEQNACQKEALKLHNILRACHGVSPLVLDDDINRKAQAYADYLAQSGRF
ncbi:hypothetical protein I4U23_003670 [Adineta vaga]|nr:hypothetical protein I4U23_003670 [Adineta vaga]